MNITKAIQIIHLILIIILVITVGFYAVNLMFIMGGAYRAVDDPCGVCESITGYTCEKGIGDTFCTDDGCIKINLTG